MGISSRGVGWIVKTISKGLWSWGRGCWKIGLNKNRFITDLDYWIIKSWAEQLAKLNGVSENKINKVK